jgi:hypothetical protein
MENPFYSLFTHFIVAIRGRPFSYLWGWLLSPANGRSQSLSGDLIARKEEISTVVISQNCTSHITVTREPVSMQHGD